MGGKVKSVLVFSMKKSPPWDNTLRREKIKAGQNSIFCWYFLSEQGTVKKFCVRGGGYIYAHQVQSAELGVNKAARADCEPHACEVFYSLYVTVWIPGLVFWFCFWYIWGFGSWERKGTYLSSNQIKGKRKNPKKNLLFVSSSSWNPIWLSSSHSHCRFLSRFHHQNFLNLSSSRFSPPKLCFFISRFFVHWFIVPHPRLFSPHSVSRFEHSVFFHGDKNPPKSQVLWFDFHPPKKHPLFNSHNKVFSYIPCSYMLDLFF